jgi:hypothetical protein
MESVHTYLKYCTPYWGVIFDDQAQNVTSLDDASRLRISRIGGVEMEARLTNGSGYAGALMSPLFALLHTRVYSVNDNI